MSLLGKPSLKRQITTPKFNLFLAVGFPTHPTYSFMEGLVLKQKKWVWTGIKKILYHVVFFEESHSLIPCHLSLSLTTSDQASSLFIKNIKEV